MSFASRRRLLTVLAWITSASSVVAGDPLICERSGELVKVRQGERTLLVYQSTPNEFKPYVRELSTPGGVQILLDSPHDHVHHHALMYAIKAETVDFWAEAGPGQLGSQRPRGEAARISVSESGRKAAIAQSLDWISAGGDIVLREERDIHVARDDVQDATLVTWRTRLSTGDATRARLWGSHYNGLGMRFVRPMDEGGSFFNPGEDDGIVIRGQERNVVAPWCAYTAAVGERPVTVAMFGHPGNFRGATTWFTMTGPFAYLAATLDLYRQRWILRRERPIDLVYGIAVWDGRIDAARVEALYRKWLKSAPVPENTGDWSATHVNVARARFGTKVTASSQYGPEYGPEKVIDGKFAVRETDKWNSAINFTPHYLRLDLGEARSVDRIRIYHEGILPDGDALTTADFRVQTSDKRWGPWLDLVPALRGNTRGITEHVFAPRTTRSIRLLIETGEQEGGNAYGRIFEVEVYSPRNTERRVP